MPLPIGYHDPGRSVLAMTGADARAVLQGVVTNDVTRLGPGAPIYAALLTPQGKYLFDFFLIDDGARVLIDVAADRAAALAQRLGMYCLRRDARVAGDTGLTVSLIWAGSPPPGALADPRDPALGWRFYSATPPDLAPGDPAEYEARRINATIPATGAELIENDSYILEMGFEALGGVDFRKGCYVGQEVTARMKHKAELKKRLVRVRVDGAAPPGTPILAGDRPAGTLYSQAGGFGLAHLRLDRLDGPLLAGAARVEPVAG